MKKKVCRWLDSNEMGGLLLNDKKIMSCCSSQSISLIDKDDLDFSTVTGEEIQNARKALFEGINDGTNKSCQGCFELIEKEESEIEIGPVFYFPVGIFNTCNFRCQYCGFTDEQLGEKLDEKHAKILPIIQNFHKNGLLKPFFNLGLTGGEPSLITDIPEALSFIAQNYESMDFTLFSNSSVTNRAEKLVPELSKIPENINKILCTSIDAGTPETYKKVRGKDLYYNTVNNIINYAKHSSFDTIILKYIIQLDHSNTSDEDLFGFLNLVKLISQNYSERTSVVIDRDCNMNRNECVDDEIIAAAGKLYYAAEKILGIKIDLTGSSFNNNIQAGIKDLDRLKEFAADYEFKEKSPKEFYYLNLLSAKNDIIPEITNLLNFRPETKENVKNLIENNKGKKICLYGAGSFAEKFLEKFDLSELNVLGFIDKNNKKRGTEFCGYKVYSIDDIQLLNPDVLVLTLLEKKYCMPFLENLKIDKKYNFNIIHDLFKK